MKDGIDSVQLSKSHGNVESNHTKNNTLNIVPKNMPHIDKHSNHLRIRTLWLQLSPTISFVNPRLDILKRRHHSRNRLHRCPRPTTTNRPRKVFKISSCRISIGVPDRIWICGWRWEHVDSILVMSSSWLHGSWDGCGRETRFCSGL